MTWKAPPILDDPDRTVAPRQPQAPACTTTAGALRLVAWKTKRGVYWISNTLTQSIGEAQMIEIACSLQAAQAVG